MANHNTTWADIGINPQRQFGQQRTHCPQCGGRRKTLSIHADKGLYHCFRCGWSGRVGAESHWLDAQGLTGLYQQMRETARAYQSDDHLSNSTNAGTIILLALRRIANARRIKHPQLEKITFPTSDLHASVNAIAREMDLVGDDEDFISSKSLGWRLRRMRLKRPEARNPAAREWELPIDLLDRAEIARGIPPSGEMSETAAMSETTRNPDVSDVSDKSDISTER